MVSTHNSLSTQIDRFFEQSHEIANIIHQLMDITKENGRMIIQLSIKYLEMQDRMNDIENRVEILEHS